MAKRRGEKEANSTQKKKSRDAKLFFCRTGRERHHAGGREPGNWGKEPLVRGALES